MPLTFSTANGNYLRGSYNTLFPTTASLGTVTGSSVQITGITGPPNFTYNIIRNGTTIATGQSGTTYTDSTVAGSTTYTYQIVPFTNITNGLPVTIGTTTTPTNVVSGLTDINGENVPYPYTYPVPTTNYGSNWANTTIPSGIGFATVSCSSDGKYVVVLQSLVGIWISSNYGVTFTKTVNINTLYSVFISPTGKYMYITTSTNILYSSDYGVTFNITVYAISSISFNEQYVFAKNGSVLYYSTDFGTTWNTTAQFGTASLGNTALSYTGSIQAAFVGTNIYVSTNYGSSWTSYSTGFTSLTSVRMSRDGKYILSYGSDTATTYALYIGSWNGTTYSWNKVSAPGTTSVRNLLFSFTCKYITVITFGSNISYSTDYGVTWATPTMSPVYNIPTNYDFYSSSMSLNGKNIITGWRDFGATADLIFESNDYGATYTQRTTIPVTDNGTWMSIAISADGYYQFVTGISTSKTVTPMLSSG